MFHSIQQTMTPPPGVQRFSSTFARPVVGNTEVAAGLPVNTAGSVPVSAHQAIAAPQIRFGHRLFKNDYIVEQRLRHPVGPYSVSKTVRAFIVRDLLKREQGDTGTIKHSLNSYVSLWPHDEAALADAPYLVDRPVDVIINSHAGPASMMALMNTTGKRFMSQGATLSLGPSYVGAGYSKAKDQTIRAELFIEFQRAKEDLLMARAGVESRKQAQEDLASGREFNALQALMYGKKGLVDAVLVGSDQVLTRAKLAEFFKDTGKNPDDIKKFLSSAVNIKKIPGKYLQDVSEYTPQSMVPEAALKSPSRVARYHSVGNAMEAEMKGGPDQQQQVAKALTLDRLQIFGRPLDEPQFALLPRIPFLKAKMTATPDIPSQMQLRGPSHSNGLLYDDVIFFNDGFDDRSAEQIVDAIQQLDSKKAQQREDGKDPSHIKIMVNSPGGLIYSGNEIWGAINHAETPVDVIITGMAASCGAYLMASATGNRIGTLQSRLMLHEAASAPGYRPSKEYYEGVDTINEMTQHIAEVVADASGRPVEEVAQDFKLDTWLNPLEAMFYGPKGLMDAVLVAPNTVVTRDDVKAYLVEKLGGEEAFNKAVEARMRSLRNGRNNWRAEQHNENDPFDNPLKIISAVAERSAKPLNEVPKLKGSVTRPQETVDQFIVGRKFDIIDFMLGDGELRDQAADENEVPLDKLGAFGGLTRHSERTEERVRAASFIAGRRAGLWSQ